MSETIDLSETKLEGKARLGVMVFCEALRDVPHTQVQSITLYGSAARDDYRPEESDVNLLVVLERIDIAILRSLLAAVNKGRRHGIAPFFITEANLRSSADVFPVKFLAMREFYRVLMGRDVLGDLEISREHLRLRCEQETKNLLLRLRRHYVAHGGRRLTDMMVRTIVGFLETLRVILSLTEGELPPREAVIDAASRAYEFDATDLKNINALRGRERALPKPEAEGLYDKYMTVVEKMAQVADQME